MALSERFGWLVLGMAVGFVLGYIVAQLKAIERKVDTVDEHIKQSKDEQGFMRIPLVADVLYLMVLAIVVWGAVAAQHAANETRKIQECIKQYNEKQGVALQGRDQAVKNGIQSEIDLWLRYENLYRIAKKEPERIPALQEELNKAIVEHRKKLEDLQATQADYAYPGPDVIENCEE
jgi:hypothetical protein